MADSVLRWMRDNIFVHTDPAGTIYPNNEKSMERIDSAIATIMAWIRRSGTADLCRLLCMMIEVLYS